MDINEVFFEEPIANDGGMYENTEAKLPFPPKDFKKDGKLKRVRGRVLGRLLKAELKYYLPVLFTVVGLLLLSGLFFGISLRKELQAIDYYEVDHTTMFFVVTSAMFFLFACVGGFVFMQIYPVVRYNKSFFQNEGYLTFSLPASMEEHVLAKRISAVLCSFAVGVAIALSFLIVYLFNGEFLGEAGREIIDSLLFELEYSYQVSLRGQGWLFGLEFALSLLVGSVMLPCLYALLSCLLSKMGGKRRTGVALLLVFLGVGLVQSLLSYLLAFGEALLPATVVGFHISAWISIALELAVTVGSIFLEIWYLKNKLDLK